MEIVLDARRFKGRTRAHAYLKEALGLPDYYGKNLDALYDCLGDIAEETVIVVPDVIQKKEYLGDYGRTMLRVFKDAAAENPALQIKIK
ncbi:MAG: barstar family protein [Acidaminococcaceae bacterium]|nr:barstar family protein [Acidaminococcaceae bacterium]MBR1590145.1 barstar family protein [Acidaminococcaceae bacterium]